MFDYITIDTLPYMIVGGVGCVFAIYILQAL